MSPDHTRGRLRAPTACTATAGGRCTHCIEVPRPAPTATSAGETAILGVRCTAHLKKRSHTDACTPPISARSASRRPTAARNARSRLSAPRTCRDRSSAGASGKLASTPSASVLPLWSSWSRSRNSPSTRRSDSVAPCSVLQRLWASCNSSQMDFQYEPSIRTSSKPADR